MTWCSCARRGVMQIQSNLWYRILVPRSTVIVTTVDVNGVSNTAPFSFVMPVSAKPPLVAISSAPQRHTLANIRDNKEFVLNLPTEKILNQTWLAAKPFARGTDEIKESGLTKINSEKVKPPRIAECYGWIECKLWAEYAGGDHQIIVGEIVAVEVQDGMFDGESLDCIKANPLLHIAGPEFATVGKIVRSR